MTISIDQLGLDLGARIGLLMRRFYPLLLQSAYQDAGDVLALDLAFDVENERVQDVLDTLATEVRRVAETTRDQIRVLVGRQAEEGWNLQELAKQIRALGDVETPKRALRIAQTETAAAYSRGSILAYQDSGVVSGVEWLTAGSEVCDVCQPLNGQVADLGGDFAGGVAHPPAHPGCRCAIAPVVA